MVYHGHDTFDCTASIAHQIGLLQIQLCARQCHSWLTLSLRAGNVSYDTQDMRGVQRGVEVGRGGRGG